LGSTLLNLINPIDNLPNKHRLPGVALELVNNEKEFKTVVDAVGKDYKSNKSKNLVSKINKEKDCIKNHKYCGIEIFKSNLKIDQWLVVPIYVFLFIVIVIWLIMSGIKLGKASGLLVIIFAILAGISDTFENSYTITALERMQTNNINF